MTMKKLADIEWLHLGRTNEYKDLKKFIADICYDVTKASCINEICINDICAGFRLRGYEVVSKDELDRCISESDAESLKAELTAAKELIDAHYYIMGEMAAQIMNLRSKITEATEATKARGTEEKEVE